VNGDAAPDQRGYGQATALPSEADLRPVDAEHLAVESEAHQLGSLGVDVDLNSKDRAA